MLPQHHSSGKPARRSGLNIRQSAAFVLVAAVLFLLTATVLYSTAPDLVERSHLRRATVKAAKTLSARVSAVAKTTASSAAAAKTAAAAAAADLPGATASAALAVTTAAKEAVSSSSFARLAQRGKDARARANANCKDLISTCPTWAAAGECTSNPGYMRPNCPKSCDACLDAEKRDSLCHRRRERQPLLRRGGVHATFERLIEQLGPDFKVNVLSRPPRGPWVVTIEDFVREHEIRALMEKGGHHFERSLAGDGVSPVRTSKTSWCNVPFCESDPTIKSIKSRVANATGVPLANSEHVQILQYDVGDFYRQHHDQNAHPHSPWGPRLYTFFLYLSNVPEGGGTRFTHLNITVEAKRGMALFWPSVLDSDPSAVRTTSDHRTTHEALTVTRGQKYAANMWLHQFDFQSALAAGCKNEDQAVWRPASVAEADEVP